MLIVIPSTRLRLSGFRLRVNSRFPSDDIGVGVTHAQIRTSMTIGGRQRALKCEKIFLHEQRGHDRIQMRPARKQWRCSFHISTMDGQSSLSE